MASIQQKGDSFYCQFVFKGKRRTVTIGKVSRDEADTFSGKTDYLLMRIKQGFLQLPQGISIEDFILRDGKVSDPEVAVPEKLSFAKLTEKYLETQRHGAMEENSLATVRMHLRHFQKSLGERFPMNELSAAELQDHVNRRAQKKYRGKKLSPVTLRTEMRSLRAAWNWAVSMGLVVGTFPSRGLVYPKQDEKLPFMTLKEIERKIFAGMTNAQKADLFECVYLTPSDLDELLAFVKANASHAWIYPLFSFAAYTGARRSEILRTLVTDVDFDSNTIIIREKKRSRKQRTTRRVPMTPFLVRVLRDWLAHHPGGLNLFCHEEEVPRSKKRSRTTGHLGEKKRASTAKERMSNVGKRNLPDLGPLTRNEVHDHFQRVLAGSKKWKVLRGLHVLRHSFISACASKGIDQRLIDEWTGHSTDEQRKRYRHLYPTVQQEAISSVFGGK